MPPATDPAGPTGRLATWLAATTLADVPASVQEYARYLLLDGIGRALVGAQLPASRRGVDGLTALDGGGRAALIGWGRKSASPQTAALLNSSFIQPFELDDYRPTTPLHSNSIVLPAMLAAASQIGPVHGRQLLLGAILGYETGGTGDRALTNDQIREKFRALTSGTIRPDRQAATETAVLNVDSLDDISPLVALLTPVVNSPLD
jgi:2-methylcitrate dehydratase PrpD